MCEIQFELQNGDGRLSVEEIHGIYSAHGVDVTREEVQKIVDAADKDGTGLLTEKEFVYSQAVGDVSEFLSATSLKYSLWCRESTRTSGPQQLFVCVCG